MRASLSPVTATIVVAFLVTACGSAASPAPATTPSPSVPPTQSLGPGNGPFADRHSVAVASGRRQEHGHRGRLPAHVRDYERRRGHVLGHGLL